MTSEGCNTSAHTLCYCLSLRTGMASELHPRVTLLEGHHEGGEVNHRLQLVPGFVLENRNHHTAQSNGREVVWGFCF